MLREFLRKDIEELTAIYNYYIQSSHSTFETESIDPSIMEQRINSILENYPFLVYEHDAAVIGYAYATRWKNRQAYDHTVESSVYIHHEHTGKGIGKKLYKALLAKLKNSKTHCVLAGISLPNSVSIKLHEDLGFKKSGVLREVGYKFDRWIDVGYWQLEI